MPEWILKRTDTFLDTLRKHKHNTELLNELDKKIQKLLENPLSIGGYLSGNLYGYKSTRLIRKFRLIFSIDEKNKTVYLVALDHRKDAY